MNIQKFLLCIQQQQLKCKVFEERVDKIEKVLEKLEEAIIDLTGDISEIKNKINDILIELKMERQKIQDKANTIYKLIKALKDDDL